MYTLSRDWRLRPSRPRLCLGRVLDDTRHPTSDLSGRVTESVCLSVEGCPETCLPYQGVDVTISYLDSDRGSPRRHPDSDFSGRVTGPVHTQRTVKNHIYSIKGLTSFFTVSAPTSGNSRRHFTSNCLTGPYGSETPTLCTIRGRPRNMFVVETQLWNRLLPTSSWCPVQSRSNDSGYNRPSPRKDGSVIAHVNENLGNRLSKRTFEFQFTPISVQRTPWPVKEPNLNLRSSHLTKPSRLICVLVAGPTTDESFVMRIQNPRSYQSFWG